MLPIPPNDEDVPPRPRPPVPPVVIPTVSEPSFFAKHKNTIIGVALVAVIVGIGYLVK